MVPYYFYPPKNGGHHAAVGFATALAKQVPLVCISTKDNVPGFPVPIIPFFPSHFSKYINPILAWRAFWQLQKIETKFIILHQPFIGFWWGFIAKWLRIPLAVYVQNIEYQRFKSFNKWYWPIIYGLEWWMYRRAEQLFFISPVDAQIGKQIFGLQPQKSRVVPYGTFMEEVPLDRDVSRQEIILQFGLPKEKKFILFFGPQSYQPNHEAVQFIIRQLLPLVKEGDRLYFLIAGGGMQENEVSQIEGTDGIAYLGFVKDINQLIKGVDIVLNPILTGGGIKTKVIESIALGTTVISSKAGAIGIDQNACKQKLIIVSQEKPQAYLAAIQENLSNGYQPTPKDFYRIYSWDNAILPVLEVIQSFDSQSKKDNEGL